MIGTIQFTVCDVCRIIDHNCDKKECFYCSLCDANICQSCSGNWPRRIKAAIKRKLEPGYVGQDNYAEMIQEQLNASGTREHN